MDNTKLVLLTNLEKLIIYKAQGLKIISNAEYIPIKTHDHIGSEKKEGFYQKQSVPGSFFDPHTDAQDIKYQEVAANIVNYLDKNQHGYKEYIIVAGAKLTGYIKPRLPKDILQGSRFIIKDIAEQHDHNLIEKMIFS